MQAAEGATEENCCHSLSYFLFLVADQTLRVTAAPILENNVVLSKAIMQYYLFNKTIDLSAVTGQTEVPNAEFQFKLQESPDLAGSQANDPAPGIQLKYGKIADLLAAFNDMQDDLIRMGKVRPDLLRGNEIAFSVNFNSSEFGTDPRADKLARQVSEYIINSNDRVYTLDEVADILGDIFKRYHGVIEGRNSSLGAFIVSLETFLAEKRNRERMQTQYEYSTIDSRILDDNFYYTVVATLDRFPTAEQKEQFKAEKEQELRPAALRADLKAKDIQINQHNVIEDVTDYNLDLAKLAEITQQVEAEANVKRHELRLPAVKADLEARAIPYTEADLTQEYVAAYSLPQAKVDEIEQSVNDLSVGRTLELKEEAVLADLVDQGLEIDLATKTITAMGSYQLSEAKRAELAQRVESEWEYHYDDLQIAGAGADLVTQGLDVDEETLAEIACIENGVKMSRAKYEQGGWPGLLGMHSMLESSDILSHMGHDYDTYNYIREQNLFTHRGSIYTITQTDKPPLTQVERSSEGKLLQVSKGLLTPNHYQELEAAFERMLKREIEQKSPVANGASDDEYWRVIGERREYSNETI